jgi:pyridinium-3,5-bisthiocarboxylic acid mononucleotide nickel chelatase
MTMEQHGVGAGTNDRPGRPNVVRVVIGTVPAGAGRTETVALLETNVDDLDPRLWPGVVDSLLAAGALDVWLTPVVMKKGRPGHVLGVLAGFEAAPRVRRLVLDRTSALGVRQSSVEREILDRAWLDVAPALGGVVEGSVIEGCVIAGSVIAGSVAVKVGHRDGTIVHATPEFEDVARLARAAGRPEREVLDAASAAAAAAGVVPGAALPAQARAQLRPR